jgi:hypothetical protein
MVNRWAGYASRPFPIPWLAIFIGLALAFSPRPARPGEKPAAQQVTDWWSLRPLKLPPTPASASPPPGWPQNPIDQFILAKLREKGLEPAPRAEKRTWLRRVTFDLIGLPPTVAETDAFLADDSAGAFARVVDRLLASPHYGERWARHWMDAVHYAETHGHDQDRPRPNAWPYRDYLIRSFNDDKPYARFVAEQVAGDILYPDNPQGIVATGFIATGPWDESSLQSIMEDTVDKKIARYLDRDDMVTTTMATFVSTTAHCARCHDHKFDPIPQADYYALQAVFAGVDRAERPYEPDQQTAARRRELLRERARLEALRNSADPSLLATPLQAEVAAWERTVAASALIWTALDPATFASAGGATLTKLPDLSLLCGGKRPEVDTYTIVAHTTLKNLTGVRLEVLTDDSLPLHGPGRMANGNLHLTEFRLSAAPRGQPSVGPKPVVLQNPTADFNQDGWTIAHALDGNPKSAWGIYPAVGQSHRAVFECREPIGFDGGTTLTFVLEQNHGGGHLIGRPRLSVTAAPRPLPLEANSLPPAVADVLRVPLAQRNNRQKATLGLHLLEKRLEAQLAALPALQMVYAAANDFKPDGNFTPARVPRPIHVLRRGDVNHPQEAAQPGALSCVNGLPHRFTLADPNREGDRRAALARWLTDPANVLTWRSIVNRVWHYHFGRGLVETPNDFGRMGAMPSHPELLDWLATTFRDGGGSLKQLHRVILTSAVYRQSMRFEPRWAALDGDNRYLWRMNRTRLDAESVRDAVLAIAGKLDPKMGGPSVKQFIQSPGIHITPKVDYLNFDADRPENYRRSVYRFIFRTLPDPFMEALDCPDSSQLAPTRTTSVTALQALAMLNDRFIVRQSEHLAERITHAGADNPARIHALYLLALGRAPTRQETDALAAYANKHGLANACRILLNCNEFLFVN